MATPLAELNTRIDELKADVTFVSLAAQLRPRIAEVINWQSTGDVLELAKQFMKVKLARPEGVFGPLLIRLLAAFERYLRQLVIEAVNQRAAAARTYDDLPATLSRRNLALTGRVLAAIDAPRDHLTVDVQLLVDNLASCKRGSGSFRLNAQAFSAIVTGASPMVIEKSLENVDVTEWWDVVGVNQTLAGVVGTKGPRETRHRAGERLKELWRWRNHLAHGGDEDITLSETQLREAIDFVACFSDALDDAVKKQLKRK
jgi:hypothetical protein